MSGEQDPAKPFIVGVGASAGGLDALTQLFEAAPRDCGMAFIVVQHLSPDYKSMIAELLTNHTHLRVRQAQDEAVVEADSVYVIQPQTVIQLQDGHLHIEHTPERVLQPINLLFRSLADECGAECAAIVLSGTGSDGAEGLKAVKEHGGITVVQRPDTARFDGMPQAALGTGAADLVLSPDEIVQELVNFRQRGAAAYFAGDGDQTSVVFERLLSALRTHTGIDFSHYKPSTAMRRVERRMQHLHLEDLREYAERVRAEPSEAFALQKDLLIGVTRFLRDPGAIEAIRRVVIPRLLQTPGTRPLRLWVAGCATGEEAYSLAMMLQGALDEGGDTRDFKIFATDIDAHALEAAGRGEFSADNMDALPQELRQQYFRRSGEGYVVTKALRERLLFSRHNVITDPPFSRMDMVSCRNLLIYLKPDIQDRVLRLLGNSLVSEGVLWLGSSETLGDQATMYSVLDGRWKVFAARPDRPRTTVMPMTSHRFPQTPNHRRERTPEMGPLAEAMLEGYLPPTLVVDDSLRVLYQYGEFHGLLQVPQGRVSLDLRDMLPKDLAVLVATATQRTRKADGDVQYTGLQTMVDGTPRHFTLVARQVPPDCTALIFDGLDADNEPPTPIIGEAHQLSEDVQQRVAELERELRQSRENLQATVEELESSNEELQATNEELVAANEELQSTNEELQSVNEELHTVNAEHSERLEELSMLTDDLDNLLGSLDTGVVFLDPHLCIRRFNPKAARYLNILAQDTGRPLAHLTHRLSYPTLLDDCAAVLRDGSPRATRAAAGDGVVQVRISAMRAHATTIKGLVVSLTDVTDLVTASDQAVRLSRALDQTGTPQCLLDRDGNIEQVTPAFLSLSGRDPEHLIGAPATNLADGDELEVVREIMARVLAGGAWSGILHGQRPDGMRYLEVVHLLTTRDRQGKVVGAVRVSEDVTGQLGQLAMHEGKMVRELFLWDTVDGTAECTPAFARVFDLDPFGRPNLATIAESMSRTDLQEWQRHIRHGRSTGAPWQFGCTVEVNGRGQSVVFRAYPLPGNHGPNTRIAGAAIRE